MIFVPFAEHDAACDNMGMRARRLLNLLIALSVAGLGEDLMALLG